MARNFELCLLRSRQGLHDLGTLNGWPSQSNLADQWDFDSMKVPAQSGAKAYWQVTVTLSADVSTTAGRFAC